MARGEQASSSRELRRGAFRPSTNRHPARTAGLRGSRTRRQHPRRLPTRVVGQSRAAQKRRAGSTLGGTLLRGTKTGGGCRRDDLWPRVRPGADEHGRDGVLRVKRVVREGWMLFRGIARRRHCLACGPPTRDVESSPVALVVPPTQARR